MPTPNWVAGRLREEPFVSRFFYNTVLKRSSTYMTGVMVVATTVGARDSQSSEAHRPSFAGASTPASSRVSR